MDWWKLWERLNVAGLEPIVARLLKSMFGKNRVRLNLKGVESEWIGNYMRVRQGSSIVWVVY